MRSPAKGKEGKVAPRRAEHASAQTERDPRPRSKQRTVHTSPTDMKKTQEAAHHKALVAHLQQHLYPFPCSIKGTHQVHGIDGNSASIDAATVAFCTNAGYLPPPKELLAGVRAIICVFRGLHNAPVTSTATQDPFTFTIEMASACYQHIPNFPPGHFLHSLVPLVQEQPQNIVWHSSMQLRIPPPEVSSASRTLPPGKEENTPQVTATQPHSLPVTEQARSSKDSTQQRVERSKDN